jgi:dipeptidyl aminopeptidase/acylaminoacyl peptidase
MKSAPFGTWVSPITPALAASGAIRLSAPTIDGDHLYWLEGRPLDGGRTVLVCRRADGRTVDVTPAGFQVRTRVHEYGGGAFVVSRGTVYFSNDADQRLWRQPPDGPPVPLTPATSKGSLRFADATVDVPRERLICVCEDHADASGEPINSLVSVALAGGAPHRLVSGADFYSSPRISPDGKQLAYLCWRHPNMPWEGTELWVANVDEDGTLSPPTLVAGGPKESVVQPAWSPDGRLHFISDRSGWWNLYRSEAGTGTAEPLCPMEAEFAPAPWVFGLCTYGWLDGTTIFCAFQREGAWHLGRLDTTTRTLISVETPTPLTEIGSLQVREGSGVQALFTGASPRTTTAIFSLRDGRVVEIHRPTGSPVADSFLSVPRAIQFPTSDGAIAHALHYPPCNADYTGPPGDKPPLILISHGGPTGGTSTALNLALQFWTSRGFTVLDVDYRGSTGHGRAYREALDGKWGLADVDDCLAGARHLVAEGAVDGARLVIRGSSAGGYTTLAALTFHKLFRAGASYYGVSDLEALARDTHKFESRYLDGLIGPYPARRDLYQARSPLAHVDRLTSPVIFLQGLEDKVVPPVQAERMVEALRKKGIETEYVTFANEQHGFRRAENVVRALDAELSFYDRILGLS